MKLTTLTIVTFSLLATTQMSIAVDESSQLTEQADKLSYSFGQNIGNGLKQQDIEVNLDLLIKGIRDALSGNPSLLTDDEMKETLLAFRKERFAKQAEVRKQQAEDNLKEGEAFLAENAKKEGVITLPSGLQYKVITPGTGKTPQATDKVTTHYRGTLIDGTEFDSSYKRDKPTTFGVDRVIAGWTEALQLMKEGAKWQLFIPSDLAYGRRGAPGGQIGPNATLIFEIELLSVETTSEAEKAPTDEKKASAEAEKEPTSTTSPQEKSVPATANQEEKASSQSEPESEPESEKETVKETAPSDN